MSNSNPTTCINDIIREYNFNTGCYLKEIEREIYFARLFNCMERLIDAFQQQGPEFVLNEYYKYWLHAYVFSIYNDLKIFSRLRFLNT